MRECLERRRGENIRIRYVEVWGVLHTSARDKEERETGQAKGEGGGSRVRGAGRGQERQGMCVLLVLGRLAGGDCIDVCDCELLTEMGRALQNGWTPLLWAAEWGRSEVVQELLAKGADIEAKNKVREGGGCVIGAVLCVSGVHLFLCMYIGLHLCVCAYVRGQAIGIPDARDPAER